MEDLSQIRITSEKDYGTVLQIPPDYRRESGVGVGEGLVGTAFNFGQNFTFIECYRFAHAESASAIPAKLYFRRML